MEHSSNLIHSTYRGMIVSICHHTSNVHSTMERNSDNLKKLYETREVAVIRNVASQQEIEVIDRWYDFESLQDALEEARRWIDAKLD